MKCTRKLSLLAISIFILIAGFVFFVIGCANASIIKSDNNSLVFKDKKSLIVYFTYAENIGDTSSMSIDAITSASLHMPTENTINNTKLMVDEISKKVNADIYSIVVKYPYDPVFDNMTDKARDDIKNNKIMELQKELPDISKYENIYIGSPLWWYTIPAPVKTFLSKVDLSNKTVIPFGIHRGSGLEPFIEALKELQPNAEIADGFTVEARTLNEETKQEFNKFLDQLLRE